LVLPVFDRNSTGLFRAAFTTTFYDEIALDDQTATHGPEVDPEVAGNNEQQLRDPVAESEILFTNAKKTQENLAEDADAFVGGFNEDHLDDDWLSLEAELAALEPDEELTEPFGTFDEE